MKTNNFNNILNFLLPLLVFYLEKVIESSANLENIQILPLRC